MPRSVNEGKRKAHRTALLPGYAQELSLFLQLTEKTSQILSSSAA
jgi:hypothetical protein